MQAIETIGRVDYLGNIVLDNPLKIISRRVRIIVLIPEESEISDMEWLTSTASNPAFGFLNEPEENIYTVKDGKPIKDEA